MRGRPALDTSPGMSHWGIDCCSTGASDEEEEEAGSGSGLYSKVPVPARLVPDMSRLTRRGRLLPMDLNTWLGFLYSPGGKRLWLPWPTLNREMSK